MYKLFLENAFLLDEDSLLSLIEKRKQHLESKFNMEDEPNLEKIHHGYMSERTKVLISEDSMLGYNLKGINYFEYLNYLKDKNVNINDLDNIMTLTGEYVTEFFAYNPFRTYIDRRNTCIEDEYKKIGLVDISDIEKYPDRPSINIFRGNGQGICLEHSLLMQQLLSFIGVDTTMVVMYGYRNNEYKVIGHVGNIVHFGPTEHIYYDLVYREFIVDEYRRIHTYPNRVVMSDEDYRKFINEENEFVLTCKNDTLCEGEVVTYYLLKSDVSFHSICRKLKKIV